MRHIPGIDRSQVLLLPEAVDDYVGRDNPVRFIDAFVDGLDLAAAGFERAAPKATGRPGYTLRRVVLLTVNRSVLLQNTVDDIREGGQWAFRWLASPKGAINMAGQPNAQI